MIIRAKPYPRQYGQRDLDIPRNGLMQLDNEEMSYPTEPLRKWSDPRD